MMPYWARIALGAFLGLAGLVATWLLGAGAATMAAAAALPAAIGFLGSYFVWSADRLDEGYEQVLFDRPNTIVASVLVVLFAGAGVAGSLLGGAAGEPAAPPGPETYLYALRADYQRAADAWAGEAPEEATLETLSELRVESDRIALELEAVPEDDARAKLVEANDALALALDELKGCVETRQRSCMPARLLAADAEAALASYAELQAPPAA